MKTVVEVLCLGVGSDFFFKQKTAYERRISDWSSDVCSSDLPGDPRRDRGAAARGAGLRAGIAAHGIVRHHAGRRGRGACPGGPPRPVDRALRSEERRVGTECVSRVRSRWAPDHTKTQTKQTKNRRSHSTHYHKKTKKA